MARRLHGWHEACCSLPAPPGDPVVATLQAFKEGGKAGARLAPLADALHSLQVDALHFPRSKVLDGQEGRVAQLGGCTKVKGVGGGGCQAQRRAQEWRASLRRSERQESDAEQAADQAAHAPGTLRPRCNHTSLVPALAP